MSSPFAAFARIALYENGVDGTSKKFEKTVTNNDDKKKKTEKRSDLKISAENFWTEIFLPRKRETRLGHPDQAQARVPSTCSVAKLSPWWPGPGRPGAGHVIERGGSPKVRPKMGSWA